MKVHELKADKGPHDVVKLAERALERYLEAPYGYDLLWKIVRVWTREGYDVSLSLESTATEVRGTLTWEGRKIDEAKIGPGAAWAAEATLTADRDAFKRFILELQQAEGRNLRYHLSQNTWRLFQLFRVSNSRVTRTSV